jgi:dihydropteroate synthase
MGPTRLLILAYLAFAMFYANFRSYTLSVKGRLLWLGKPLVMGILNVTDDSFFDGGKYTSLQDAIQRAGQMIEEGADVVDIGAMSSKPGAQIIDPNLELRKVVDVVTAILDRYPNAILSVDTLHAKVAEAAIIAGAAMINDISGGMYDKDMLDTIARFRVPFIMMHMRGLPANMQDDPAYEDLLTEVLDFFIERIHTCAEKGISDVVVDPGFGFGKTTEHNYELLGRLSEFKHLDKPILVGLSRKSMVWKLLNINPQNALNGTTALHMAALLSGANMLRVHDVKEAVEVVKLYQVMQHASVK